MNEAYDDEKLSPTQVYFWYKRFKDGRKSIADDSKSGRPLTSITDRNIGQVGDLIVADRNITIDNISEIPGISCGSCQKIIGDNLNMIKLCGYFLTKFNRSTKRNQIINLKIFNYSENNYYDFSKPIITGDVKHGAFFLIHKPKNNHSNGTHQVLQGGRKFVLTSPEEKFKSRDVSFGIGIPIFRFIYIEEMSFAVVVSYEEPQMSPYISITAVAMSFIFALHWKMGAVCYVSHLGPEFGKIFQGSRWDRRKVWSDFSPPPQKC
ncbi:hypothetical protein LAZ67_2006651 [Cordylochernes scorpioides]|uniref:Mos1 transposase HTH domain-containing protein n=1 Tax=Cordylochernes scorpioides TaxID=51811 RepID=A0ABY6K6E8_9ARAC|nr:hypothetical protein LAZ67_2006651 [Cordylochernes scorpioides]